jgi:hypothetical protein
MGCKVWAVGSFGFGARFGKPYLTGVEYYDGRAWKLQKSPNPGGRGVDNILRGVAVTSSTNAWTVGWYGVLPYELPRAFVLHWDGTSWKVQKSPHPTASSELDGVVATSSNNAWAVGSYGNRAATHALIEHWDGIAWQVQPSPNPGGRYSSLSSIAATSPSNVWAVGSFGNRARPLVEHWDGTSWKIQSSPRAAGSTLNYLEGVAATSRTNAWAVGYYYRPGGSSTRTLVLHWNGRAWKRQSSPNARRDFNDLLGVAATSRTNAWAVGSSPYYKGGERILLEHWNGTAWKLRHSPIRQGRIGGLEGVAANASTNVWAVGRYTHRAGGTQVLALHWDGAAWSR